MQKKFLEEEQLILDAFKVGVQIFKSDFRPTFIIGIWRGGSAIGIYIQECLQTLGIETNHLAIRTSYRGAPSYPDMVASPQTNIRVHGTDYLLENLNAEDRLLIVDDAFSSGLSIDAVINKLRKGLRQNMPKTLKVATIYQRPSHNKVGFTPDYCLYETEDWLVFPYELSGLSRDEIRLHKPYVADLLLDETTIKADYPLK